MSQIQRAADRIREVAAGMGWNDSQLTGWMKSRTGRYCASRFDLETAYTVEELLSARESVERLHMFRDLRNPLFDDGGGAATQVSGQQMLM